jgi:hypothetical protein
LLPEPTLAQLPEPPDRPPGAERRGCVRYYYRCGRRVRYVVRSSFRGGWAVLQDISPGGVGLLLGHRPEAGTVILLQLSGPAPGDTHTRLARVLRTEPRGPNWVAGCEFTPPLSEAELEALRQVCRRPR